MTSLSQTPEGAVSMGHVADVLRRGWVQLLAGFLLGLNVAAALFAITPATYSSRSVVAITHPLSSASSTNAEDISTATESAIVTTSSVAERAAPALQWTKGSAELLDQVQVTSPVDSQLLEIRFTGSSPDAASRGANAFATAYLSYRTDTAQAALQARSDRLEQRIAALEKVASDQGTIVAAPRSSAAQVSQAKSTRDSASRQIRQLRDQQVAVETTIVTPGQIIDKGFPPTLRNFPRLPVFLLAGVLIGLLGGVAAAFWRASHDTRIADADRLEHLLQLPVLASIPAVIGRRPASLAPLSEPGGSEADGYRALAVKLMADDPKRPRSFLVVPVGNLSITTTPVNLAVTLAARGHRVALMGLGSAMKTATALLCEDESVLDPGDGLVEMLSIGDLSVHSLGEEVTLDATLRRCAAELQHIRASNDVVIVDSINVSMTSTALGLARLCDRSLLAAQQWRTRSEDVASTAHELRHVPTTTVGAVLLRPITTRAGKASRTKLRLESSSRDFAGQSSRP